jgi:hypothetical protein
MGRHLLSLGLPPGKKVGELLESAYDAQLEGSFNTLESALDWLVKNHAAALRPESMPKTAPPETGTSPPVSIA